MPQVLERINKNVISMSMGHITVFMWEIKRSEVVWSIFTSQSPGDNS